jgi:hypothetical protein
MEPANDSDVEFDIWPMIVSACPNVVADKKRIEKIAAKTVKRKFTKLLRKGAVFRARLSSELTIINQNTNLAF